jgi:hypothetical protein
MFVFKVEPGVVRKYANVFFCNYGMFLTAHPKISDRNNDKKTGLFICR